VGGRRGGDVVLLVIGGPLAGDLTLPLFSLLLYPISYDVNVVIAGCCCCC
jgi:hypothetical protein